MLRVLKFPYVKGQYWLWSDLHGNHNRDFLYEARNFSSIGEHDNTLIVRWNEKLDESSIMFLLGDTALQQDAEKFVWRVFNECKFRELYISPGNHPAGWKQIYYRELEKQFRLKEQEVYPLKLEITPYKTVYFMPNYYEIRIGNQDVCLSHYPIISHHGEGRGSFCLCGHSHNNLTLTQKNNPDGKRLDLGVEGFPYPVSYEEIQAIMGQKSLVSLDHHH
jgi:calcineurin-like phosphoesterase family protein